VNKLIVVENDKVSGTDTHKITGTTKSPPLPVPYTGTGKYEYLGKMTQELSDFVKIDGKPVALKGSKSSLNPDQKTLSGKHNGSAGGSFDPPDMVDTKKPITITDIDGFGEGTPSAQSGSSFVTINNKAILLDGDKIDTCDGTGKKGNSTVTAAGQMFVSCSE
jgi:uncharacterized Zn-binding protein involved in type VI secretion